MKKFVMEPQTSFYAARNDMSWRRPSKTALAWRIIMKKTVITVVGKDSVGIIAKVCTYLANNNINILDISQTIVQGFFNMMMIADTNETLKDFSVVADELEQIGQELGCDIKMQREDIFDKMHRI